MDDYLCAISGKARSPRQDSEGELGDLPIGWARVTVERRLLNPRRKEIEQTKREYIAAQLAQVPEDKRAEAKVFVGIMADVQFAAIETATPRYLQEDSEVHVSEEEFAEFAKLLGIADEDEKDEDGGDEQS